MPESGRRAVHFMFTPALAGIAGTIARTIADLDGSEEVTGGTSGGGDSISRV